MKKETKIAVSYRITKKIQNLINILSQKLQISKTAVITLAIKQLYKAIEQDIEANIDMEALAAEVGKQFGANLEPITESLSAMTKELIELKEWRDKQEENREVDILTKSPRFVFDMQKHSSEKITEVKSKKKEIDK